MAWASTIPAAIDNLAALLHGWPGLAGVQVIDGPKVSGQTVLEVVTIGFGASEDTSAVEGSLTREGLAVSPSRETYGIRCATSVLNGSGDIAIARRRAYQLLSEVGGALASDHTLSGAVMQASIGDVGLVQDQTTKGAVATVAFSVDVDAYTDRS